MICDKLNIFCSNKADGNMSEKYDKNNTALINRKIFFNNENIDINRTIRIQVLYKDEISIIDSSYITNKSIKERVVFTDAVIIKESNIFVYLLFADCTSFIIYDQKQKILALAHLGWQS